jgi:hypothetical protein
MMVGALASVVDNLKIVEFLYHFVAKLYFIIFFFNDPFQVGHGLQIRVSKGRFKIGLFDSLNVFFVKLNKIKVLLLFTFR